MVFSFIALGCVKGSEIGLSDDEITSQLPNGPFYGRNQMCVQWTTPFAVQTTKSGKSQLIWGWTDKSGHYGVGSFNKDSKRVSRIELGTTGGADMHNSPAVIELDDGRIGVVSCKGHNAFPKIWITISKSIGDITSFDKEIEVTGFAGKTTYAQVIRSNSKYYIFTRTISNEKGWRWQVITSPDFKKWSTPKNVVLANGWQYYVRFVKIEGEQNLLRMVMYSNPTYSEQTHIRMGYINLTSGNIYTNSVAECDIIGNFYKDNAPLFTSFETIIPKQPDKNQRFFDVAYSDINNITIAFARWTTSYDSEYYIFQNGEINKICDGGEAYIHDRAQLGARLINSDYIAVARNEGGMDYVEIYKITNGEINLTDVIDQVNNGNNHTRLLMPMLDESSQYLFYAKGSFDPTDYRVFDSDLVFNRIIF